MDIPQGEVSVLLGPSGTGKSVFLKSLIGLLRPERGKIIVDGTNIIECSAKELYEIRTLFGVMFQDGALFGSMSLYDNTAFPLREHTKKKESEIRNIVMEKLELVGLGGDETKFPGEISGGMRKRAGLARSLVLDPQIILCDEPDSGLDPVRTAYLSQLLIDINAQIDCTILIVTHNINIARTVPDNMGMLFRKHLVMFGPREVLLTSDEPVVRQFLNGRRIGPIGMSEEKDESTMAEEQAMVDAGHHDGGVEEIEGVPPQIQATPGMPERQAVGRRQARVREIMHTLPPAAQEAIRDDLEGTHKYAAHTIPDARRRHRAAPLGGRRADRTDPGHRGALASGYGFPMSARAKSYLKMPAEQKPTFCRICEPLCGMIATVDDGRLVSLRPDKDHPLSAGFACQKGIAFTEVVNDPDRVTTPLRRTVDGGFEPVSWDEAMTDIADRLADIHRRHGSGAIGWYYGNPGAFSYSHTLSLSMFMLGFGPRLHVFTAGSQDVNNRFVASQMLYGSPLALPVPDVLRTDLLVVIGANPLVSHGSVLTVPRIKDRMHDIVKRGGRVLVIDPRKTETAAQFEWLGIIPDGDAYLLLSLLHVLFGENLVDRARLARQADGAVWLEQLARPFSPEATEPHTGIDPDTVRSLARDLARTRARRGVWPRRHQHRRKRHAHNVFARCGQPRGRQPRPCPAAACSADSACRASAGR